jgi:hypothetical protein
MFHLTGRYRAASVHRAVPRACVAAQARPGPLGHAVLGPGQNIGPQAGPPGRGLHGHIYSGPGSAIC